MTYFARVSTETSHTCNVRDVAGFDASGVRRLALAMLARAGMDLQSLAELLKRPHAKPRPHHLDALAWLLDTRTTTPGSLRWCCDLADHCAENYRAHTVAMIDRNALRDRLEVINDRVLTAGACIVAVSPARGPSPSSNPAGPIRTDD